MARYLLPFLCCCLFFTLSCEDRREAVKTEDESPKPVGATFSEWSSGLPSTGQWREGLGFFDLDADGYQDILATPPRMPSPAQKKVFAWHTNEAKNWTETVLDIPNMPLAYGTIDARDFDGDSLTDLVLAIHSKGLHVLKGTKEGKFKDMSKGLPPVREFASRSVVCADFNNDGISDFAAAAEWLPKTPFFGWGGVLVCTWQGDRWKCSNLEADVKKRGILADQLVAGDVNGDGNMDIAVASVNHLRSLIVWLGDGKGNFKPFNKGLTSGVHYNSVELVDVNQDGRDDLLASISFQKDDFRGAKVFLSAPDGFTDDSAGLPTMDKWPYFVSAGDFEGDGNTKIVLAPAVQGGLKIFERKKKQWQEVEAIGLPEQGLKSLTGIYCKDLDGDGRDEIATIHSSATDNSGGIRVFSYVPDKR